MSRQLALWLGTGFFVLLGIALFAGLPVLSKGWISSHEREVWGLVSQLVEQKPGASSYVLLALAFATAALSRLLPLSLQSFAIKLPALPSCIRPVCDPAWGKGATQRRLILGAMATAWFVTVLAIIWHHEFWRDEVRALSIAIASPSLWDLPELLKNEGHPVVWYTLLRIGHQGLGSMLALPMVSLLVAGAAVMIFLFRSPFSLGLKFLFVFSVLPLYEYSVMARSYGVSMLLMFGFAWAYPHRRRHPFLLAVLLALLANTNIHSLLLAGVLTGLWLWDEAVFDRQNLSPRQLSLALGLIFAAALFAVNTVMPDERTIVTHALHAETLKDYLAPVVWVVLKPWQTMGAVIPFPESFLDGWPGRLLQVLLAGALLVGLAVRPRLAFGLFAAFLALGFLFNFMFPGSLRHHGLLLVFTIVLYWLTIEEAPSFRGSLRVQLHRLALGIMLPLVLLWGDYLAIGKVWNDFKVEVSSCKALGHWLNSHPEYQDAIILGEPDYNLEALAYYTKQRIYIPRESRFGNWVRFTTESRPAMSIGELLDAAQELKEKEQKTVLIALGFPASQFEQSSSKRYSYNKVLTWTPAEWQRFRQSTNRVADFWSGTRENFDIYEIR